MKYYKSTTNKEYTIDGKIIPRVDTKNWLVVKDSEALESNKVIASLIKHGQVVVTKQEPESMKQVTAQNAAAQLALENSELRKKLEEAEAKARVANTPTSKALKDAEKKYSELEAEAKAELQKQADRIAELEAQLQQTQTATNEGEGKE